VTQTEDGETFGGYKVSAKSTMCGASHENWRKLVLFWMNAVNIIGRCPELWQWMCVPGWSDLMESLRRLSREPGRFFSPTSQRAAKKAALAVQSGEGSAVETR
jgi:hypothetical protein